jgi:hypothetical protein
LTKYDDNTTSGSASSADHESLSVLMDGEANDLDIARALRGVADLMSCVLIGDDSM